MPSRYRLDIEAKYRFPLLGGVGATAIDPLQQLCNATEKLPCGLQSCEFRRDMTEGDRRDSCDRKP